MTVLISIEPECCPSSQEHQITAVTKLLCRYTLYLAAQQVFLYFHCVVKHCHHHTDGFS